MFGPDEDEDFPATVNSKLASLFGQPMEEGNASLTYTAPKQPKKNRSENASPVGGSSGKLNIIVVQAVHTYKLEGNNYVNQGKLGAALLGNAASQLYQLLIYKNKQQHITSTKITDKFQFTVQAQGFASFYDDRGQNWSIMFESEKNAVDFAREIGLARACVPSDKEEQPFYVQDLKAGEGLAAELGDLLEIRYTTFPFVSGKLEKAIENNLDADKPQRVSIRKGVWEEALVGATKSSKRLIVLAPVLYGPWKPLANSNNRLVVEVEIGRIKAHKRSRDSTPIDIHRHPESSESNVDSSTDETSIKARGASISEALTNSPKTHKASIISRMARMGQATLPLKGAVTCNPSDSEETEEESGGTVPNTSQSTKAALKPRNLAGKRSLASQFNVVKQEATSTVVGTATCSSTVPTQQMSLYQPASIGWQQQQQHLHQHPTQPQQYLINGVPVNFTAHPETQLYAAPHQVVPVPAVVPTPTSTPSSESHLSVYFSENRTHNAEVRIGLTKVVDKVDNVLGKLDALQQPTSVGVLEPRTLLASIQKLVLDNEKLQGELTERRVKMEEQNEKIYQLLHHKFLEQSNSSGSLEQRQDVSLQAVVLSLQQEKAKLATELNEMLSKMNVVQIQATNFERISIELREEVKCLTGRLQTAYIELDHAKQALIEQENLMMSLKEKTDASVNLHDTQDSVINDLKVKMRDLLAAKSLLETTILELKQQLENTKKKAVEQISLIEATHKEEVEKFKGLYKEQLDKTSQRNANGEEYCCNHMSDLKHLEKKNEELKCEISDLQDQLKAASDSSIHDLKKVMNVMFRILKSEFSPGTNYDGSTIREIMLSSIQDVTLQYVKMKAGTNTKINDEQGVSSSESKVAFKTSGNSTNEEVQKSDNFQKPSESVKISTKNEILPPSTENKQVTEHPNEINQEEKTVNDETETKEKDAEKSPQVVESEPESKTESEPQANIQIQETEPENTADTEEYINRDSGKDSSLGSSLQIVKPRESSIERGWRPQPPPSPTLFDDEEDDDDWLR